MMFVCICDTLLCCAWQIYNSNRRGGATWVSSVVINAPGTVGNIWLYVCVCECVNVSVCVLYNLRGGDSCRNILALVLLGKFDVAPIFLLPRKARPDK